MHYVGTGNPSQSSKSTESKLKLQPTAYFFSQHLPPKIFSRPLSFMPLFSYISESSALFHSFPTSSPKGRGWLEVEEPMLDPWRRHQHGPSLWLALCLLSSPSSSSMPSISSARQVCFNPDYNN